METDLKAQSNEIYEEPTDVKPDSSLYNEDNKKNIKTLYCKLCDCKVLKPGFGTLVEKKMFIHFDCKSKAGDKSGEVLQYWWVINNMMDFENVGFSLPVDGQYRYLTCADCETPCFGNNSQYCLSNLRSGVQRLVGENKDVLYVAATRVKYL